MAGSPTPPSATSPTLWPFPLYRGGSGRLGRVDILVNNASGFGRRRDWLGRQHLGRSAGDSASQPGGLPFLVKSAGSRSSTYVLRLEPRFTFGGH
jgi:hypothetical protein